MSDYVDFCDIDWPSMFSLTSDDLSEVDQILNQFDCTQIGSSANAVFPEDSEYTDLDTSYFSGSDRSPGDAEVWPSTPCACSPSSNVASVIPVHVEREWLTEEDDYRQAYNGSTELRFNCRATSCSVTAEHLGTPADSRPIAVQQQDDCRCPTQTMLPYPVSSDFCNDVKIEHTNDVINTASMSVVSPTQSTRRRTRPHKQQQLWQFLQEILANPDYNPCLIEWIDRQRGVFRFVESQKVARLWGQRRKRANMSYEYFSRAMRHYYARGIMNRVCGRRLVYQFGPNAGRW